MNVISNPTNLFLTIVILKGINTFPGYPLCPKSKQNYWKFNFFVDKVALRKTKMSNKIDKCQEVNKGYS